MLVFPYKTSLTSTAKRYPGQLQLYVKKTTVVIQLQSSIAAAMQLPGTSRHLRSVVSHEVDTPSKPRAPLHI